jgi:probable H4MPT-linked C1 transfer pathway protein
MSPERTLGWDLGGAHLKAALISPDGAVERVMQLPCPLWKGLGHLIQGIRRVCETLPQGPMRHAVTMTGECVDLFENRERGVRALVEVIHDAVRCAPMGIYAGDRGFLSPRQALRSTASIASANWLASASWAARGLAQGLFVDVGSTTTDVVPMSKGRVLARGHSDFERLQHAELIYIGVVRTPVMVLTRRVPFAGAWVGLAAEHFATTADVYRLTNALPPHADLLPTADQGGKNLQESARRLARMLGRDVESAAMGQWRQVAGYLAGRQLEQIKGACELQLSRNVLDEDAPLVGAGVGRFLVRELAARMHRPYRDVTDLLPPYTGEDGLDVADCAPAVAVALLAQDAWRGLEPVDLKVSP